MNYAIVYLAAILFFAAVYWYIQGKKFYTGPLIEAEIEGESQDADRSSEEADKKKQDEGRGDFIA